MEDILKKVSRIKNKNGFKIQSDNSVTYLIKKTKSLYIIISIQQTKEEVILISYKKLKKEFDDFVSVDEDDEILAQFEALSLSEKSFKLCTKESYILELKKIMERLSYVRTRKDLLDSYEYENLEYSYKIKRGQVAKFEEAIKNVFCEVDVKRHKESYGTISINIPVWYNPTFTTIQVNINRHNEVSIRQYAYIGNWPKELVEKIDDRVSQILTKIDNELKWYKETEPIEFENECVPKLRVVRRRLSSNYIVQDARVKRLAYSIRFFLNDKKRKKRKLKIKQISKPILIEKGLLKTIPERTLIKAIKLKKIKKNRILKRKRTQLVKGHKNKEITYARKLKFAVFRDKNLAKVVLYKKGICLDDFPVFTREGYVFLGWFTERKKGKEVKKETINVKRNINLYAHWKKGKLVTINHYLLPIEDTVKAHLEKTETKILTKLPLEACDIKKYKKDISGYNYSLEKESLNNIDYDNNVINIYYERDKFEVKVSTDEGVKTVTGAGKHYAGTEVILEAELNKGFSFSNWKQGFKLINKNPYIFIMPKEDITIFVNSIKRAK